MLGWSPSQSAFSCHSNPRPDGDAPALATLESTHREESVETYACIGISDLHIIRQTCTAAHFAVGRRSATVASVRLRFRRPFPATTIYFLTKTRAMCTVQHNKVLALFGKLFFWLISRLWLICCERKILLHG
jgi:hypothetical protein